MSLIDNKKIIDGVEYLIFDPSKNITALVISNVEEIAYTEISKDIVLPLVFYSSIAHVIIGDNGDVDYEFIKNNAETLARDWCDFLGVQAIGLMHYSSKDSMLTPFVYVKSVDTLFWENACASGTAAIGEWANSENDKSGIMNLKIGQPSGAVIETFADKERRIYLKGKVRI